jgi:branched-chain amino acid transport system permease protein
MIISIGVSLLLRYLLLYFFGGDTRPYAQYVDQSSYEVGPLLFAPKDIAIIGIAVVVLVMVSLALSRTRIGKAMRAVSDNPPLAASSGINVSTVIAVVWAGGAALAGLSGVLLGVDQQVEYQTGFKILLLVFAAVTLGGLGTIWGAMLGSVIVGLLVEMSTLFVPTELKYVGAFVALIVILLVRPQGLLGRRERVG